MRMQLRNIALRTALWYGLLTAAWAVAIVLAIDALLPPGRPAFLAHVFGGWLFAATTATLLFFLMRRLLVRWAASARRHHDTQQALRHSEDRYTQLAEALTELAWTARGDGRGLRYNRRWTAYTGPSTEATRDAFPAEIIHPDERAHAIARLKLAIETGTSLRTEFRMRRRDGVYHWFELNLMPLRDHTGRVVNWFGIHTDIEAAREAAATIRENELRNQTLLEALADGVFVAQDHRFVYCNPALPEMLGYTAEEFVGLPFERVLAPEFLSLWVERYDQRISARPGDPVPPRHYEVRLLHRNGNGLWIELRANRIEYNRAPAVLGIIRDVTARKRAETAQLHSQKLEALGTLAGGIAHDFNNILLAIAGNTRLAQEELGEKHPTRESLDEIEKASRRASALVQRILAFGRAREQERHVIALGPVVQEALGLVKATLPGSIALHNHIAGDVPLVSCDSTQIHQIVVNLATNAAHAIGDPGGVIEFSLSSIQVDPDFAATVPGLRPGHYAKLSASDNGCGMDRATLERIFDPFFTTKPIGEGTGLGLATVHGIVKSHDGAVSVYSQPGKGTTFHIYLPAAADMPPSPPPDPPRSRTMRGGHVLYVDDDEDLVFLMRRLLDRLGYRVSAFTHPYEALAAFEASPGSFDVVVTDLTMPGVSGLGIASRVREVRPDLPVVITSGYVRPGDQEQAKNAGASCVVLKPSTIDELASMLERLIGRGELP